MRLLLALFLWAMPVLAQDEIEETPPLPRYLAHLYLGDDMDDIQKIYPPAQEWPSFRTPRGGVTRYRVERSMAKKFPTEAETLFLGMKGNRLVEIQVVYHERFTRKRSAEELAGQLALEYGPFRRNETRFWWSDGNTVLRVFNHPIPVLKDGAEGREFRTSIQVMNRGLFNPDRD